VQRSEQTVHGRRVPVSFAALARSHDGALSSGEPIAEGGPATGPRPEIGDSWERLRRLGLSPDRGRSPRRIGPAELEDRRRGKGFDAVMPILRSSLLESGGDSALLLAVADADGHLLWLEGDRALLRTAHVIDFEAGVSWTEDEVGTNGIGLTLRTERPSEVQAAEHYLRRHHGWTCVGTPIRDPRTGRLVGIIDLSGPAHTGTPYLRQLTTMAARLAETELRARHLESLHRLRTLAVPLMARFDGPALVVDGSGWTAAVAGMPTVQRLAPPIGGWGGSPVQWLPSLGHCAVEPLAGGWLVRPVGGVRGEIAEQSDGSLIHLDLRHGNHPELRVSGAAGSWSHTPSPRHAEILLLLAAHREGMSASQLAEALFGDPERTVTIRAELSRLRRHLGALLEHRPYRLRQSADVTVRMPDEPYDLLPGSSAPAVRELRVGLATGSVHLSRRFG
jgi:hypothetical protein